VQLEKIDRIIKRRQENVKMLNQGLEKFSDIIQIPELSKEISYLAYPIIIKRPDIISRRELREKLERKGIETRPLFGCIPTQQEAYAFLKEKYIKKLPNANYIGENGFYIGCHQYLTKDDIDHIINAFEEILKQVVI
jgi:CDP-6-deoxy-D-xylo-4-hexulose-3-dehydrase